MRHIEVEKKFALPDRAALSAVLSERGAIASAPARQIDAYYNAPDRDFLKPTVVSEWLRLRTEPQGSSINFKRWHPIDDVVKTHADEYESTIGDTEAVRLMLDALGYQPLVTVDKTRTTWLLDDVEIVLDHVVDAGDFVEFEFKGDADTVEAATTHLVDFITGLDIELGEPINRGYPHMLLGREH